jgi:mono/diheme cytochrome c family protein
MPIRSKKTGLSGSGRDSILLLAISAILCAAAACSSPSSGTGTATATGDTFGQLALEGQDLYDDSCGECHGLNGQGNDGPPLWAEGAQLGKYNNASTLLTLISATMPKGDPGSLSHQTNVDILAYILIKAGDVASDTPFSESQLASIPIT